MWNLLPLCMTEHGLCPRNPLQTLYWAELSKIPWTPPAWQGCPSHDGCQHLFVDGSCTHMDHLEHALAAWSLVSADLERPVAVGLLPGCLQTSNRSEVWALVMATQWLIDFHCDGCIYSDSKYAVDGFLFLVQQLAVPGDWADRDLWDELLQRLLIHDGNLEIRKVKAHLAKTSPEQTAYETHWNAVADTCAKAARLSCSSHELSAIRARLISVHCWQLYWTRRSQEYLLALALHCVQRRSEVEVRQSVQGDPEDELVCYLSNTAPNMHDWMDCFPLVLSIDVFESPELVSFGAQIALAFCQWLIRLDHAATHLKQVTLIEFFMGYHLGGCLELPVAGRNNRSQQVWIPVNNTAVSELIPRTLQSKLDVFAVLIDLVFDRFGLNVDRLMISKPQLGIHRTSLAFWIPWPDDTELRVNHVLSFYTSRRPIRQARDLARAWP